jgi:hypothetical protein
MDPRLRADEALAHARARGAFVVTPDNATSPMDADSTVRIPRELVQQVDDDSTQTLPAAGRQMPHQPQWPTPQDAQAWPTEDFEQALPPNPYQGQRATNEFGPLGSQQQQHPRY